MVQLKLVKSHQDDNAFSKTSLVLSRHISSFSSRYMYVEKMSLINT